MSGLMDGLSLILKQTKLFSVTWHLWRKVKFLSQATFRQQERTRQQQFQQFKQQFGEALAVSLSKNGTGDKRKQALLVGIGFIEGVKTELGLIKALELAGFEPVVLTPRDPWLTKYYQLAGVRELLYWDDFIQSVDAATVKRSFDQIQSFEDLLDFKYAEARVGRFAASTALRYLRVGSLDVQSPQVRQRLSEYFSSSMTQALRAQEILQTIQPELAIFADRGYSPIGELFDTSLAKGITCISWNSAHKSNALLLKRYTLENRDEHFASLAPDSWRCLQSMAWTETHRQRLQQELYGSYASGDWYSEVGTQFNKRLLEVTDIKQQLGLDPDKKTAVIFPHILWDGTFFWGEDLFRNYEEWFVETVRAACKNNGVNWIIKVHPANIVKNVRDGVESEPSEIIAIKKYIGQLPSHVFIIPADSDINTFSLFSLMDYCVTVRGTIGIEAAGFGIPVLTAGTGRYDHKGFTIDSETREEYLDKLKHIQQISALSQSQQELAERFAYGVFVMRPLALTTVTLEFEKDAKATARTRINITSAEDWFKAPDIKHLAEWLVSGRTDYLESDL